MGIFSSLFNRKTNMETTYSEANMELKKLLSQPEYEFLDFAIMIVFATRQASTSMLQRRLKLGYARAARLIDQMEELGIVGPFMGSHPREIIISKEEYLQNRAKILGLIDVSELSIGHIDTALLNNVASDVSVGRDYTKIDPEKIILVMRDRIQGIYEVARDRPPEAFLGALENFKKDCLRVKLPPEAIAGLEASIEEYKERIKNRDSINEIDKMEGHEFEKWCADLLRRLGFSNVEVTKGSGDQGVDVLAEKDGIRYAFQCKNYSSPLGNTPVQEVAAGKDFYNCHIGVVITNNYFTSGAKQLAERVKVLLWDRDELERMIEKSKTL